MAAIERVLSMVASVFAIAYVIGGLLAFMRKRLGGRGGWIVTVALCLLPSIGHSATFYVKPSSSGSGTGADWTNALGASFTPSRGNTYYIADGTYGSKTWSTANSGTTLITIKKATVSDHGTSTGWSDTLGDGQAVWDFWFAQTDYWLFDGQVRNSDWRTGAISQYGFRVACTGDCKPMRMDVGDSSSGADNVTFQYIDFEAGGRDIGAANSDVIYTLYGGSNITFQFCAFHDSDRTIWLTRDNPTNWTIDHSYIARNASSPAIHGEMWSLTSATNITFSNNVVEDTEGTSCMMAGLNNGTWDGAAIFGNTVRHTSTYIGAGREGCSAAIYVADDASQTNTGSNIVVQNNTFVNLQTSSVLINVDNNPSGGNVFRNNMLYNTEDSGINGFNTIDSNWIFSTVGSPGGTNLVTCTVSCDLFVNLSGGDFHLASPTTAGATLSSPYNIDPDGVTRGADGTWDRGAFEYVAGGGGGGGVGTLALFLEWVPLAFGMVWHFRVALISASVGLWMIAASVFSSMTTKTKSVGYHATLKIVSHLNERMRR